MKKTAKRVLSIALVLVMVFSLGAFALADGEKTPAYESYTCLGDSIAAGLSPENTAVLGFQRVEGSYPALLADAVGATLEPDAYSGFTTNELRYMLNDDYRDRVSAAGESNGLIDQLITREEMDAVRDDFKADVAGSDFITLQIGASDVVMNAANSIVNAYNSGSSDDSGSGDSSGLGGLIGSGTTSKLIEKLAQAIIDKAIEDGNIGNAIVSLMELAERFDLLDGIVDAAVLGLYQGYADFEATIDYVMQDIYALNPDVTLVVVGMYDPFDGCELPNEAFKPALEASADITAKLNAKLQEIAATYGCPYADVTETETWPMPAVADNTETNNVITAAHPSAAGHQYIASQILESLTEFINKPANPFVDVNEGNYYYDSVLWAYYHEPQITGGRDASHFCPMDICTRAQIVTFIWRANGCPEPQGTAKAFNDVVEGSYYYKAVLWAAENGITGGFNDGGFHPNELVTRAQAMTFLWRANNKPAVPEGTLNTFEDVADTAYYHDAVLWAVANGITGGYDASTFGSMDGCTRAQIVTFLYRALA